MDKTACTAVVVLVACALALGACGHEGENLSGQAKAPATPPGKDPHAGLDMGGRDPHAGLDMGGDPHAGLKMDPHAAMSAPAPEASATWTTPAGWTQRKPSRPLRVAEFDVGTTAEGVAVQCVLWGGIVGSVEENVDRWIGQMGPDAKGSSHVKRTQVNGLGVTRIVARGRFLDPMAAAHEAVEIPEATMLAAVAEAPDGTQTQVKLVGPSSVVDGQAENFDAFVASLKPK
jgi:hypothetical protein